VGRSEDGIGIFFLGEDIEIFRLEGSRNVEVVLEDVPLCCDAVDDKKKTDVIWNHKFFVG
jgi:hypothetical protein